jgi:predicted metalloprotease with PDZ domain
VTTILAEDRPIEVSPGILRSFLLPGPLLGSIGSMKPIRIFSIAALLFVANVSLAFAQATMTLNVDATDASRNIVHSRLSIPVRPGPLTLFYPKWIPGEHSPTGPINDLVGLKLSAGGKTIPWRRDDVEMFAFHCDVPPGVSVLDVTFDDASQPETTASAKLARVKWNRLLLYTQGTNSDAITVKASLKLPTGWRFASALPIVSENKGELQFKEVSLTQLVDSPAIIGANFRTLPLSSTGITHEMDVMADTTSALEMKPETLAGLRAMVQEAYAMFGARHYRSYKFLVTLSDHGGSEGLEHHESSEDGVGEKAFSEELELLDFAELIGHEYAHSWNGKYRRPAGLATPDFDQPMKGELLWVYEGLTQYLGKVLPARSGLWSAEDFREAMAAVGAQLENQSGREWRPLVDTAVAVQFTYPSPRAWTNYRRRVDYYDEGSLIWLEADVLIRRRSNGKLSLDDFCRRFHGGQDTGPIVKPYTFDDVVNTLNEVTPYDWRGFLNARVNAINPHAPLAGITNGGWNLVYTDKPNTQIRIADHARKSVDLTHSLGMLLKEDGTVMDTNPNFPAFKAGLAPGMKILSVNGRTWSTDVLHEAIASAKNSTAPIELVVENGSFNETYKVDYHGGERYPHLERDNTKPDIIGDVIKSRAR